MDVLTVKSITPYLIPGIRNFRIVPDRPAIKSIHFIVCTYYGIDPILSLYTRKTQYVQVRHWTMLLSCCCGYTLSQIADYFNVKHPNCSISVNKLSDSILRYKEDREAFKYFFNVLNLKARWPVITTKRIKVWLYKLREYQN